MIASSPVLIHDNLYRRLGHKERPHNPVSVFPRVDSLVERGEPGSNNIDNRVQIIDLPSVLGKQSMTVCAENCDRPNNCNYCNHYSVPFHRRPNAPFGNNLDININRFCHRSDVSRCLTPTGSRSVLVLYVVVHFFFLSHDIPPEYGVFKN